MTSSWQTPARSPELTFCTLLWGYKSCYATNLQHLLCQTQQSCLATKSAPDLGLQGGGLGDSPAFRKDKISMKGWLRLPPELFIVFSTWSSQETVGQTDEEAHGAEDRNLPS